MLNFDLEYKDLFLKAGQKRLSYMYPKNRASIRSLQTYQRSNPINTIDIKRWNFAANNIVSSEWSYGNMIAPKVISGTSAITSTSTNADPLI